MELHDAAANEYKPIHNLTFFLEMKRLDFYKEIAAFFVEDNEVTTLVRF